MDIKTRGYLINLIEEANEIGVIAAKCLRFGMDSYDPNDPHKTPNRTLLARELGNLDYISQELVLHDEINPAEIQDGALAKSERLKKYPLIVCDVSGLAVWPEPELVENEEQETN